MRAQRNIPPAKQRHPERRLTSFRWKNVKRFLQRRQSKYVREPFREPSSLPLSEGGRKRSAVLGCVLACYRADDDETHADTDADYTERQRPPVPGLCTAHDTMIK